MTNYWLKQETPNKDRLTWDESIRAYVYDIKRGQFYKRICFSHIQVDHMHDWLLGDVLNDYDKYYDYLYEVYLSGKEIN